MSIQLLKNFKNNRCWSSIDSEEVNFFLNSDQSNFKNIVSLAINNKKGRKITVEVDNLKQLHEIIGMKFNTVLFDNMSVKNLKKGVKIAKKYYTTEASGNINLKSVKEVSKTGIDRISVGSITHSAKAIDFKLEI